MIYWQIAYFWEYFCVYCGVANWIPILKLSLLAQKHSGERELAKALLRLILVESSLIYWHKDKDERFTMCVLQESICLNMKSWWLIWCWFCHSVNCAGKYLYQSEILVNNLVLILLLFELCWKVFVLKWILGG